MKEEALRVLTKLEGDGWITINPQLSKKALAAVIVDDLIKGMSVRKFLEIFNPMD